MGAIIVDGGSDKSWEMGIWGDTRRAMLCFEVILLDEVSINLK